MRQDASVTGPATTCVYVTGRTTREASDRRAPGAVDRASGTDCGIAPVFDGSARRTGDRARGTEAALFLAGPEARSAADANSARACAKSDSDGRSSPQLATTAARVERRIARTRIVVHEPRLPARRTLDPRIARVLAAHAAGCATAAPFQNTSVAAPSRARDRRAAMRWRASDSPLPRRSAASRSAALSPPLSAPSPCSALRASSCARSGRRSWIAEGKHAANSARDREGRHCGTNRDGGTKRAVAIAAIIRSASGIVDARRP